MRPTSFLCVLLGLLAGPAAAQDSSPTVAGCFAIWEVTGGDTPNRVLLTPHLQFVNAESIEQITEEGVRVIPVTSAFAVLRTDGPSGLVALWQWNGESVHIELAAKGEELTGLATFQNQNTGETRRTRLVLQPTECR